ncbi:MAG: hypothetical protein WCG06_00755 [Candidatus Omnitrophota bacterium]
MSIAILAVCGAFLVLILVIVALKILIEIDGFYYGIGSILNRRRESDLKKMAASIGARYSLKPGKDYFEMLKEFPLFQERAKEHMARAVNEMCGSSQSGSFSIVDMRCVVYKLLDQQGCKRTVLYLESQDFDLPDFILRQNHFFAPV